MRRTILALAALGLAILPAQARTVRHHHHAHAARVPVVASAPAPQNAVDGLFEVRKPAAFGIPGGVVVPARQSYFYANENFYIDNNHWGY
jgi:hypothetical protein